VSGQGNEMIQDASFIVDLPKLAEIAASSKDAYKNANPFPHIVFDNLFSEQDLDAILKDFPDSQAINWFTSTDETSQKKLTSRDELQMSAFTRNFIYQLNSSTFLKFLENLTGIEGLIPDPHLYGGGLHQTTKGGFLKIHADFNRYERLKLDRRLNLLLYLNKDWKDEYGGHLELWKKDMSACEKKVAPLFNRTVIFSTTDFAYHGHPEPLTCPPDRSRKSIALYYYTSGRPAEEMSESHSTLYQRRKGMLDLVTPKWIVKKLMPPFVLDIWRLFKK
jgi:Rps23 Pro-64 3,4-dihydroxylase Tpa1-like proline 4-hydroxylase